MNNTTENRVLRVACYERVSTEEQARHGLSVDAQTTTLENWVRDHGHVIVGHYTDAGVSGGKPIEKRPAMWRLLHDVQAGKIDLVAFTKLDRWFRSLKNYYRAQDILDSAHCAWQAINEDYETLTASGRFKVNIMLSVAENERERTGERIRAVFDYKRAQGEFLTGGRACPYGYIVREKHLVKDPETAPVLDHLFALVLSGSSARSAIRTVLTENNAALTMGQYRRILYNPIYAGIYNGQSGFCEPYISEADHARITARKRTREPKGTHVYLFSMLMTCPACGRKMSTTRTTVRGQDYIYYTCQHAQNERDCPNKTKLSEPRLEAALTALLFTPGQITVENTKADQRGKKPTQTPFQIEAKMKRLAETYTDGLIDRETYKAKLSELADQLEASKKALRRPSEPPLEKIKEILGGDLQAVYESLAKAEKKNFWHTVLLSVSMNEEYKVQDIIFADISSKV